MKKALASPEAVVAVGGPVGVGKTTVVRRALSAMGDNPFGGGDAACDDGDAGDAGVCDGDAHATKRDVCDDRNHGRICHHAPVHLAMRRARVRLPLPG